MMHVTFEGVRLGGSNHFEPFDWKWQRGEQWAILGPNGSGKSLLAMAIGGQVPVTQGEIRYHFDEGSTCHTAAPENCITLLSPRVQRELMIHESSFYQSRWHSGIGEGQRTVAELLSQVSVEGINPSHHAHEIPNCITHVLRLKAGRIIQSSPRLVAQDFV